jgi:hypothetical protein
MISTLLELSGLALLLYAAWLVHPATIVGLAGIALILIGYTRGKK